MPTTDHRVFVTPRRIARWLGGILLGVAAVNGAHLATEFSRGTGPDYRGVVATGTPATSRTSPTAQGRTWVLPPGLGPAANSHAAYILAEFRDAGSPQPARLPRCATGDAPGCRVGMDRDELQANEQPVELHVYPDEDHSGTVLASLADSTPFLRKVFAPH